MSKKEEKQFTSSYLSLFAEQMGLLIKGGMSLGDAMELISKNFPYGADKLLDAVLMISRGEELSDALNKTKLFPPHYIRAIAIGEKTGRIEEALDNLKSYYDRNEELYSAMAYCVKYPVIIGFVFLCVATVLLSYAIPVFGSVYEQLGLSGGVLMNTVLMIGLFIRKYIIVFLVILVGILFAIIGFLSAGENSYLIKKLTYSSKTAQKAARADFFSSLAMLLKSGFEINGALQYALENNENEQIKYQAGEIIRLSNGGMNLGNAMEKLNFTEPVYCGIIKGGVASGNLDKAAQSVANRLTKEAFETAQLSVGVIEPVIIGVLCVSVGAMMLVVMLPLINIMTAI